MFLIKFGKPLAQLNWLHPTYTGRFLMRQNWVANVQCLLGVLKGCESYPRFVTTVCVEIARKFDALSLNRRKKAEKRRNIYKYIQG